jgi:cyanate lyase
MPEQFPLNQSATFIPGNLQLKNLVDEAFGQGIITVNEYRKLLNLPEFPEGNITIGKKTLGEHWKA